MGFAGTRYSSFVERLQNQKMSCIEFGKRLEEYKKAHASGGAKLEDLFPLIEEAFGLYVMPADEKAALEKAPAGGSAKDASMEAREKKLQSGMALTDRELDVLREAFARSILKEKELVRDDSAYLLYGGYEPLVVKLTTILDNKAGIGWTSYSHTGVPVQTSAMGVGSELFNGYYDQTDIYGKMMKIIGFGKQ